MMKLKSPLNISQERYHVVVDHFSLNYGDIRLQGTIKLVFQPAEEGYAGAYFVLKEVDLDDVSAIFGLHVIPDLPVGVVASRPGPFLSAAARFTATLTGKGRHSGGPHDTIDPVIAASSAVLSLQQLVSRETDPLEAAVHDQLDYHTHMNI